MDHFTAWLFNQWMAEIWVDLGVVTAPSGVLVLATGGRVDRWAETGVPLSVRAGEVVASGGGHIHGSEGGEPRDGDCEAVAVGAAVGRTLPVRGRTSASPFDGEPTVAVLEVALGLPWAGGDDGAPVRLGDLPVDRCGMVLGDAGALDGFVGLDGPSTDDLADVTYSVRHRGERAFGQVYPATLEARRGKAVLRWTVPPYVPEAGEPRMTEPAGVPAAGGQ